MDLVKFAVPQKCDITEGVYGMLQIPNCDIIMPLYEGNKATAQAIVDAPNTGYRRPCTEH